jgi:hypothetical protein
LFSLSRTNHIYIYFSLFPLWYTFKVIWACEKVLVFEVEGCVGRCPGRERCGYDLEETTHE